MIARVAVDSEALLEHKEETRHAMNTQRTLVEMIQRFGLLELLGDEDKDAFFDAVNQLSPTLQDVWAKALVALHGLNRVRAGGAASTVRDLVANVDLPVELQALADLIVIREAVATTRGVPLEAGYGCIDPEFVLADSLLHCTTVKQLSDARERGNFPKGSDRSKVWEDVFAVPASLSTEVTLLEHHFLNHALLKKRTWRDHLEWLVGQLDRSLSPGSTLRLLAELPEIGKPPQRTSMSPADAERVIRHRLEPLLGSGSLARVEVILAPWPGKLEERPHNRHLRFSCGVAISTHEGFDHLSNSTIEGLEGFTWQAHTAADFLAELSGREQVIRTRPGRLEIVIEGGRS